MSLSDVAIVAGAILLLIGRRIRNDKFAGAFRVGAYGLFAAVVVGIIARSVSSIRRVSDVLELRGSDKAFIDANLQLMVIYGALAAVFLLYMGITGSDPVVALREFISRATGNREPLQNPYGHYVAAAVLGLAAIAGTGVAVALIMLANTPQAQLAVLLGDPMWAAAISVTRRLPGSPAWFGLLYLLGPPVFVGVLAMGILACKNWARRMAAGLFGSVALAAANALALALFMGANGLIALVLVVVSGWAFWYMSRPELVAYFERKAKPEDLPASRSAASSG